MQVLQILDFESGIMMNFQIGMWLLVEVREVKRQIIKKGVFMAPFFLEIWGKYD
jgi:hypothetical protein